MTDRCRGHCCLAFPLPRSPEELAADVREVEAAEAEQRLPARRAVLGVERWFSWLTYLGKKTRHPTADRGSALDCPEGQHFYSCKMLSPEGDCLAYDNRPHFCRTYGVFEPCEHSACTWKAALIPEE
jgi:Fe-S-cluster containining protein